MDSENKLILLVLLLISVLQLDLDLLLSLPVVVVEVVEETPELMVVNLVDLGVVELRVVMQVGVLMLLLMESALLFKDIPDTPLPPPTVEVGVVPQVLVVFVKGVMEFNFPLLSKILLFH